jgi:hypothetical protein
MMTVRFNDDQVPSWARAILFWRKVWALERSGVPGTLSATSACIEGSSQ